MKKLLRYPLRRLRNNWPQVADGLALVVGWIFFVVILILFGLRISPI